MIYLDAGLYTYRLLNLPNKILPELKRLYPDSISSNGRFCDFEIDFKSTSFIRDLLRPQRTIKIEGQQAFNPVASDKLLSSVEWAMNWSIAAYEHTHLIFHAASVTKHNKAFMFPAKSGSGKSTLATFLGLKGWGVYSDELAIIEPDNLTLNPIFRPTSIKNQSIDIIKSMFPNANMSSTSKATHKGDIAHVNTCSRSYFNNIPKLRPDAVIFLNYKAGASLEIFELEKVIGFAHMHKHSFNYSVLGERAWETLANLTNNLRVFDVTYSDMSDIELFLEDLALGNISECD